MDIKRQVSHNELIANMGLKGRLISIKNEYYNLIDEIIWDKRKEFRTWVERHAAIDDLFIEMQQKFVDCINESGLVDAEIR